MDADLAQQVDQTMVQFGLQNRADTIVALVAAQLTAMPLDSIVFFVTQQAVKEIRRHQFEALSNFFAQQSAAFKVGA